MYRKMRVEDVVITDHALKRFLVRSEKMTDEEFQDLLKLSRSGDKEAQRLIRKHRDRLSRKFAKTFLYKFLDDGYELRRETQSNMNERCAFVAIKKGRKFIAVTSMLQGKKNDFWKVGAVSGN